MTVTEERKGGNGVREEGKFFCRYFMVLLCSVFAGKFKEQATSNSAWLPVLNSKVPEPRKSRSIFWIVAVINRFNLKVLAHV